MKQLINVMKDVLETGTVKGDRTGTGTISKFAGMMKFSLQHGAWPIPTTRKVAYEKIAEELEWMLKGLISVKWLDDKNNKIWNSWVGEQSGTIGPMYGEQWRNWNAGLGKELSKEDESRFEEILKGIANESGTCVYAEFEHAVSALKQLLVEKTKPYEQGGRGGTDQLQYVIDTLKNDPNSRRICVNVWHAGLLPDNKMTPSQNADAGNMALAPCHSMWQVESSPMTDMEILRQAYHDLPFSQDLMNEWKYMLSLQNKHDLDVPTAYTNARMHADKLLNEVEFPSFKSYDSNPPLGPYVALTNIIQRHTSILPRGIRDKDFTITEAGYKLIEEYKANDRPIRKLSLLCFARKHVRH